MKKCLFLFLATCLSASILAQTPDHGPKIEFDNTDFSFGTIEKGSQAVHDYIFTNSGDEPLTITNVRSSCGCVSVDFSKDEIYPGQNGKITATYNTNNVGSFIKTITVTSNAIDHPRVVLKIKGKVEQYLFTQEKGKWGLKKETGEIIIPFVYEELKTAGDFLYAKKNQKWGVISLSNSIVVPFDYDEIDRDGDFFIVKKNAKYGILNTSGIVVSPQYDYIERRDHCFFFVVSKNGKYGVLNKEGNIIIPLQYDKIKPDRWEYFIANKNGKWGYLDKNNLVLFNFEFDSDDMYFSDNYGLCAKKNGKWGFVNLNKQTIIPYNYSDLVPIDPERDIFIAKQTSDKWGIIKQNGVILYDFTADDIHYFPKISKKLYAVREGKQWNAIKVDGGCKVCRMGFDYEKDPSNPRLAAGFIVFVKEKGLDNTDCSQVDVNFIWKHSYKYTKKE